VQLLLMVMFYCKNTMLKAIITVCSVSSALDRLLPLTRKQLLLPSLPPPSSLPCALSFCQRACIVHYLDGSACQLWQLSHQAQPSSMCPLWLVQLDAGGLTGVPMLAADCDLSVLTRVYLACMGCVCDQV
jgi:hypothetical protein